jgi:y4mF family transcriptional regulator
MAQHRRLEEVTAFKSHDGKTPGAFLGPPLKTQGELRLHSGHSHVLPHDLGGQFVYVVERRHFTLSSNADIALLAAMQVRSARDIAALVRQRRRELGWSQARLAGETGTSRDWVIEFEKAKSTVELGLALRVCKALGLTMQLAPGPSARAAARRKTA